MQGVKGCYFGHLTRFSSLRKEASYAAIHRPLRDPARVHAEPAHGRRRHHQAGRAGQPPGTQGAVPQGASRRQHRPAQAVGEREPDGRRPAQGRGEVPQPERRRGTLDHLQPGPPGEVRDAPHRRAPAHGQERQRASEQGGHGHPRSGDQPAPARDDEADRVPGLVPQEELGRTVRQARHPGKLREQSIDVPRFPLEDVFFIY